MIHDFYLFLTNILIIVEDKLMDHLELFLEYSFKQDIKDNNY